MHDNGALAWASNSPVVLLRPPLCRAYALSIWSAVQVIIYSAGPEIIGLALRNIDASRQAYLDATNIALAVMIPVAYWLASVGSLLAIPLVRKKDLDGDFVVERLGVKRKIGLGISAAVCTVMMVVLFIVSIV